MGGAWESLGIEITILVVVVKIGFKDSSDQTDKVGLKPCWQLRGHSWARGIILEISERTLS